MSTVRLIAGSLLAAPALLVATATSGHAATPTGAVAFAGTITVRPDLSGTPRTADLCFDAAAGCLNGVATGIAKAKPVTGMAGSFGYAEKCTAAAPFGPTADGSIDAAVRTIGTDLAPGSVPVNAAWHRYGLVAVFDASGSVAGGVAVVAPAPHVASVPLCGSPIDLVITGTLALAE